MHSASTQPLLIHDGGDGAGDDDAVSATDASVSHANFAPTKYGIARTTFGQDQEDVRVETLAHETFQAGPDKARHPI